MLDVTFCQDVNQGQKLLYMGIKADSTFYQGAVQRQLTCLSFLVKELLCVGEEYWHSKRENLSGSIYFRDSIPVDMFLIFSSIYLDFSRSKMGENLPTYLYCKQTCPVSSWLLSSFSVTAYSCWVSSPYSGAQVGSHFPGETLQCQDWCSTDMWLHVCQWHVCMQVCVWLNVWLCECTDVLACALLSVCEYAYMWLCVHMWVYIWVCCLWMWSSVWMYVGAYVWV